MGCDTGRDEEQPVHRVWVDAFLLGIFPARNRDYEPFLRATGHPPPPLWNHADFSHLDQPVAAVSWFEAVKYCDWLSEISGKHYRLPTEADADTTFATGCYPSIAIAFYWDTPSGLGLTETNETACGSATKIAYSFGYLKAQK